MDKIFEKKYSIELPKLRFGENKESFLIDRSFFEKFEHSMVKEGEVEVNVTITKTERHLDTILEFKGQIFLNCDRCDEPYPFDLESEHRVIFAYDEGLEFDTDDIVLINESENLLSLVREFYEFIHIEIPLRRVPVAEIHLCPPNVLKILGLSETGEELPPEEEATEKEVDPRWQALNKLKDNKNK